MNIDTDRDEEPQVAPIPPEGYRLLRLGEVIKGGDRYWSAFSPNKWLPVGDKRAGLPVRVENYYVRLKVVRPRFGYRELVWGEEILPNHICGEPPAPPPKHLIGRKYRTGDSPSDKMIYTRLYPPRGFELLPYEETPKQGALIFDSKANTWVEPNQAALREHENHIWARPIPPEGYEYRETARGESRKAFMRTDLDSNTAWEWLDVDARSMIGSSLFIVGRKREQDQARPYTGWGDF